VSILIWKHLFLSVRILALFTSVSIHMTKHRFICYHSHVVIGKPKLSLHFCEYWHDLQQQPSTCMSCIYKNPTATSLPGSLLRASPPLCVKGTLQALWRGLAQKSVPPFLPGLFKLAKALQTSGPTHYPPGWALLLLRPNSGTSSTWDLWIVPLLGWSHFTRNIPDGFSG